MALSQQQLEEAFKQMEKDRRKENKLATLAADKLRKLLGGRLRVGVRRFGDFGHGPYQKGPSPQPHIYELYFELSQYDDWQTPTHKLNMKQGSLVGKGRCWIGKFDLSNDPDFANAPQKVFRVTIDSVDAHACGF